MAKIGIFSNPKCFDKFEFYTNEIPYKIKYFKSRIVSLKLLFMFAKYMRRKKIFVSILLLPILVILLHNIIPHHHHKDKHECLCDQHDSHSHISNQIIHNDLSQIDIKNNSHEDYHICGFSVNILIKHKTSSAWVNSTFLCYDNINSYFQKYSFSEEFPETIFIKEQRAYLSSESLRAPPSIA